MKLRDYQTGALDKARACYRDGRRAVLIVAPCGAGKTTIGSEAARSHFERGGRILWLAHRSELIEQAADRLTVFGMKPTVIAASGGRAGDARVTVASMQTLLARDHFPDATLVIPDEAHHLVAPDWKRLADHYAGRARTLGFTATPIRSDGVGLRDAFDALVVAATIKELTLAGHLVPVDVIAPDAPLMAGEIAQLPVTAYLANAMGKRTVVFAPHVKAATEYVQQFQQAGVSAGLVHGAMSPDARRSTLDDYRAGKLQVIVNVMVLTEGWDDPATECAILARGCGSVGLFLQITGRILRPFEGKTRALLIDLRGVVHIHGQPDDDRAYSLDEGIQKAAAEKFDERFCTVCGALLPPDAEACPECGYAAEPQASPTVRNVPLVRFAFKRAEDIGKRIATLARWIKEARVKGWPQKYAVEKYAHVYGGYPSREMVTAAVEALGREAA